MDNDHWLPGLKRDVSPLTKSAKLEGAGNLKPLCDGHDRNIGDVDHCWRGNPGDAVTFRFDRPTHIGGLRLVFDSNLNDHKRMPCYIPLKGIHASAPECLVRRFHVDVQSTDGSWTTAFTERDNFQRLVRVPIDQTGVAIRLVPDATWGAPQVTIFSVDILEEVPKLPPVPEGEPWPDVVGKVPASDLAPPENNGEEDRGRSRAGA